MKGILSLLQVLLLVTFSAGTAHGQASLFADPKARTAGDPITIVLAERTAAQRASSGRDEASATLGASGNATTGSGVTGRFAADASYNKAALHQNESVQSDLLHGTITALVVGVDSLSGNLRVQGERRLNVNGETHLMKVSGIVRPFDIRYDNSVFSYQIANADIEYSRKRGFFGRFFKPGASAKLGLAAVLGAAIFAVATN